MAVKILNEKQKQEVVEMHNNSWSNREIALNFSVSPDTIRRVLKEYYDFSMEETPSSEPIEEPEYFWNASSKFISITEGRNTWNVDSDHPNFKEALQSLFDGDIKSALELINAERAIEKYIDDDVRIEDGNLYYKDVELKTSLTDRIITAMYDGKDFTYFIPFLKNLMENPSRIAVYRLFDFLEANDIEITDDGYFIAFKKVRSDFKDIFSGTFDNSPGQVLSVPRNTVDERDNVTCSHGLHVCSKSYLNSYGGTYNCAVIKVKVHPKDVVSVPVDYNNAKMRTCGYICLEKC